MTAIELDKKRNLSFPISAMKMVEQLTGVGLLAGISNPSITFISACLYCGLHAEDPELTHEQVDEILEEEIKKNKNLLRVWRIICDEFQEAGIAQGSRKKGKAAPPTA